jgi:hypothetical protein
MLIKMAIDLQKFAKNAINSNAKNDGIVEVG